MALFAAVLGAAGCSSGTLPADDPPAQGGSGTSRSDAPSSDAPSSDAPSSEAPLGDSTGEPVPASDVRVVVLGTAFCGGAPGTCNGRGSLTVDLVAKTLETSTCVESGDAGTSDRTATTPIDTARVEKIRIALGGLRFKRSKVEVFDGRMDYLTLTDGAGTARRYSPEATCGGDYDKVVAGFAELRAAIRGD